MALYKFGGYDYLCLQIIIENEISPSVLGSQKFIKLFGDSYLIGIFSKR